MLQKNQYIPLSFNLLNLNNFINHIILLKPAKEFYNNKSNLYNKSINRTSLEKDKISEYLYHHLEYLYENLQKQHSPNIFLYQSYYLEK